MIEIKHRIPKKIDQVNATTIQLISAMQDSMRITKKDVEELLQNMFGEKSSWFDVIIDESVMNIRISPTSETLGSEEKMRLYQWFIDHHGHEIGEFVKTRIHWNARIAFRAEVGGVGFVY